MKRASTGDVGKGNGERAPKGSDFWLERELDLASGDKNAVDVKVVCVEAKLLSVARDNGHRVVDRRVNCGAAGKEALRTEEDSLLPHVDALRLRSKSTRMFASMLVTRAWKDQFSGRFKDEAVLRPILQFWSTGKSHL